MLEIVSLTGMEKRAPREMSGGQQQRVALARALVNRPRALLLDEPLGALDLKLRQQMQVELKRIQREVGITFVYVTHDQGEALTMSDRIAVMEGGRDRPARLAAGDLRAAGHPVRGRLHRHVQPARRRASSSVDGRRGRADLRPGRAGAGAGARHACGPATTSRSRSGPEKIDLAPTAPPTGDGSVLSGVVTEVVYHGTSTNYTVTTSAGAGLRRLRPERLHRRGPGRSAATASS